MEASYYAQLPTPVLLSPDLTCFQKLLYADIQSLTFQRGYCYATNAYLAKRHGKSLEHISRQITKLVVTGHLFVINNKGGSNSAGKRKLFTEATYIMYAKTKGIPLDIDKNIKAKIDKNVKHSNISNDVNKELPKGNSPASGQGSKSSIGLKKRKALKQKKPIAPPIATLHKETIQLIKYWNSFDTLTTHTLLGRRTLAPLHEQSKTVQNIDAHLYRLLKGTLYSKHEHIQAGLKKRKWRIDEVKKSIERMALACSPDYSKNPKRASFGAFMHDPHMKLGEGKSKYRFKYPFLHFINNEPVKVYDDPTRKKSEYPILVDKTIKMLTGTVKPTDKQYNQVVVQVEKAVTFLKKVSNGNFAEHRMRLPVLLKETMQQRKIDLRVDKLGLGVYNLEDEMRRRLMIK